MDIKVQLNMPEIYKVLCPKCRDCIEEMVASHVDKEIRKGHIKKQLLGKSG